MISVGRLAKEKNWRFLLKAAARGIANHPNLRVVLLGDGPERKNLENYSRELGIEERVSFLGNVPFEQVPSYLRASDFFGFTSTTETQGLVTLEALAAGLPVVAVEASGTRDIAKHGVHGFLVDEDIGAFVHAIDQLLLHPAMFENFREQALSRAKELNIMNQAKKLLEVYKRAKEDRNTNRFVKVSGN
jgi:glycosyltransferase involved in cell wall biosynthesis